MPGCLRCGHSVTSSVHRSGANGSRCARIGKPVAQIVQLRREYIDDIQYPLAFAHPLLQPGGQIAEHAGNQQLAAGQCLSQAAERKFAQTPVVFRQDKIDQPVALKKTDCPRADVSPPVIFFQIVGYGRGAGWRGVVIPAPVQTGPSRSFIRCISFSPASSIA